MTQGWSQQTRRRADRDHKRKKAARLQKQHLKRIKTPAELRKMALASRGY